MTLSEISSLSLFLSFIIVIVSTGLFCAGFKETFKTLGIITGFGISIFLIAIAIASLFVHFLNVLPE